MNQKELARAAWRLVSKAKPEEVAELSVGEIARRLHVGRTNLSRAFSSYYHYTLQQFLRITRFLDFNGLIVEGKAGTVNEALEILDIRSPANFIKEYKRFFKWTPGTFCRKRYQVKKRKDDDLFA